MDPKERRACEERLIRNYYQELIQCGGGTTNSIQEEEFTWEDCWKEYRLGGVERWLWFLVYFCGQEGLLLDWAQFFHDQIAAFLEDHQLGPEDVVQPRP
jgi:hypothetical protein